MLKLDPDEVMHFIFEIISKSHRRKPAVPMSCRAVFYCVAWKQGRSQSAIASDCHMDKGKVSRQLTTLVKLGFVRIEKHENSRRENTVHLAQHGEKWKARTAEVFRKGVARAVLVP